MFKQIQLCKVHIALAIKIFKQLIGVTLYTKMSTSIQFKAKIIADIKQKYAQV